MIKVPHDLALLGQRKDTVIKCLDDHHAETLRMIRKNATFDSSARETEEKSYWGEYSKLCSQIYNHPYWVAKRAYDRAAKFKRLPKDIFDIIKGLVLAGILLWAAFWALEGILYGLRHMLRDL